MKIAVVDLHSSMERLKAGTNISVSRPGQDLHSSMERLKECT